MLGVSIALFVLFSIISLMVLRVRKSNRENKRKREFLESRLMISLESKEMIFLVLEAGTWVHTLSSTTIQFNLPGDFFGGSKGVLYHLDSRDGAWQRLT